MRRLLLPALASLALGSTALAQDVPTYMSKGEIRSAPKLYAITLGSGWQNTTANNPGVDLAAKSRRAACGEDTFFTIKARFSNPHAKASPQQFFASFSPANASATLRASYYPTGELIERETPVRTTLANLDAYHGRYSVHFANGTRYNLDYYLTFVNGYIIQVTGYSLQQDRILARACFDTLYETLRFQEPK